MDYKIYFIISRTDNRKVKTAAKTVHNVKGAWVKEQQVVVDGGEIVKYRVDMKVTFILD